MVINKFYMLLVATVYASTNQTSTQKAHAQPKIDEQPLEALDLTQGQRQDQCPRGCLKYENVDKKVQFGDVSKLAECEQQHSQEIASSISPRMHHSISSPRNIESTFLFDQNPEQQLYTAVYALCLTPHTQIALIENHKTTIQQLVQENCADVRNTYHANETVLHKIARTSYVDVAEVLLSGFMSDDARLAYINLQDTTNNTAVNNAAHAGQLDMCKFLVTRNADVTLPNAFGYIPLHGLLQNSEIHQNDEVVKIAKIMIDKNADIHYKSNKGETPIRLANDYVKKCLTAYYYGKKLLLACEQFQQSYQNEFAKNKISRSQKIFGYFGFSKLPYYKYEKQIKEYIKKGADVSLTDEKTAFTPLHYISTTHRTDLAKLILKNAPTNIARTESLNSYNEEGNTPVNMAAIENQFGMVNFLIQQGCDVNIPNSTGMTVLHAVASTPESHENYQQALKTAKLLIDHGARVDVKAGVDESVKQTPLDMATTKDMKRVLKGESTNWFVRMFGRCFPTKSKRDGWMSKTFSSVLA